MASSDFEEELKKALDGEVRFDSATRTVFSGDASIFEIRPLGVVFPKHQKDIIATVQFAKKHRIPLTARGAATGITGGCLGSGLIVDTSKYMQNILEINYEDEYAFVEPGVVQDQLNASLAEKGYRLGPETSTGDRATLGGMLANNSAGARSLRYGKMVDCVEEVELVLSSGEVATFSSKSETFKNPITKLLSEYKSEIQKRFPPIPRRVSGYNLDALLNSPLNLAKVICGSEGTLGIATKIKVKIAKSPKVVGQSLLFFDSMQNAFENVSKILSFHPLSLEMVDDKILTLGKSSPMMRGKQEWLIGDPKALLIAEFDGETENEVIQKMKTFEKAFSIPSLGLINPKKMEEVRSLRKAGLGLLMSKRTYSKTRYELASKRPARSVAL